MPFFKKNVHLERHRFDIFILSDDQIDVLKKVVFEVTSYLNLHPIDASARLLDGFKIQILTRNTKSHLFTIFCNKTANACNDQYVIEVVEEHFKSKRYVQSMNTLLSRLLNEWEGIVHKHVRNSRYATNLRCPVCNTPASVKVWPRNGDMVPFYIQQERPNELFSAYYIKSTCTKCGSDWFVVWDDNPGTQRRTLRKEYVFTYKDYKQVCELKNFVQKVAQTKMLETYDVSLLAGDSGIYIKIVSPPSESTFSYSWLSDMTSELQKGTTVVKIFGGKIASKRYKMLVEIYYDYPIIREYIEFLDKLMADAIKEWNSQTEDLHIEMTGKIEELAGKFKQANEAKRKGEYEQAYKLFEECYKRKYNAAECAGYLGLIAFEYYKDIEKMRIWFTRAARMGSRSLFVYQYLMEIYAGYGKNYPLTYYRKAISDNAMLMPHVVREIRALCGQSPDDFDKYWIGDKETLAEWEQEWLHLFPDFTFRRFSDETSD